MSHEQYAQMLEILADKVMLVDLRRRMSQDAVDTIIADACEAWAAALRREAAYHERMVRAIGVVDDGGSHGEQADGKDHACGRAEAAATTRREDPATPEGKHAITPSREDSTPLLDSVSVVSWHVSAETFEACARNCDTHGLTGTAALLREGAALRRAMTWISVADQMPPSGEDVLVCVQTPRPCVMLAQWAAPLTLRVSPDAEVESPEYDEAQDEYFCPAGWYESFLGDHDDPFWRITCPVTHWMSLPALPVAVHEPTQEAIDSADGSRVHPSTEGA